MIERNSSKLAEIAGISTTQYHLDWQCQDAIGTKCLLHFQGSWPCEHDDPQSWLRSRQHAKNQNNLVTPSQNQYLPGLFDRAVAFLQRGKSCFHRCRNKSDQDTENNHAGDRYH